MARKRQDRRLRLDVEGRRPIGADFASDPLFLGMWNEFLFVIPAKAGIQVVAADVETRNLDSRFRRNDKQDFQHKEKEHV